MEDRLKEFLALASSSLLRLAQETSKEEVKNRESVYILLDLIVNVSPFLSMDLLESCFPYTLLRNSYHNVHKLSYDKMTPAYANSEKRNILLDLLFQIFTLKEICYESFLSKW